jgi:hypothetical protein
MEENQQQSSSLGTFNDSYYNETYDFTSEYSMEDHDAEVMDRLESQWNCIPAASYDVCQSQGRSDRPCPYGTSEALEECPLGDNDYIDISQLCKDIIAKIETHNGAMPADAAYSLECAKKIAQDCNDTYSVCDVWGDLSE